MGVDVSDLRDGDVVRAEGNDDTGSFALEGTVRVDKWGVWVNVGGFSFCIHGDDPRRGLTSVSVLRQALVRGDRVAYGDRIGTVVAVTEAYIQVTLEDSFCGPYCDHHLWPLDVTRLPSATESGVTA